MIELNCLEIRWSSTFLNSWTCTIYFQMTNANIYILISSWCTPEHIVIEWINWFASVSGYRNIPNIGIDSLSSKYGILVFTILVSSSAFRGCSVHSTFGNERNGQAYLLILILSFKLMMLLMYHYICFWTNNKLHSDMWEWWTNPVRNIGNISYVVKKWSCDFHEMMTMVVIRECRVRWWNQKSFSPSTMKLAKP